MRRTGSFLVLAVAAAALAACSDGDREKATAASAKACGPEVAVTASAPLPSDVPAPKDYHPYSFTQAGATRVWSGTTSGARDSLVTARDTIEGLLKAADYSVTKTDQEPGIEAEAYFSGKHNGSIKVQVACRGRLRLSYQLES